MSPIRSTVAAAFLVVALAAGCGGTRGAEQASRATTTARAARTPAVRALVRDYKRLGSDVAALRREAAKVDHGTLQGTPALQHGTGRFIEHLQSSHLSPKARNRMIDHAAGAVATSCEQCFQMLEADRPIPQIAGH